MVRDFSEGASAEVICAQTVRALWRVGVRHVRDFSEGASAEVICAQTVRALWRVGVRHVYISNLPIAGAPRILKAIIDHASRT